MTSRRSWRFPTSASSASGTCPVATRPQSRSRRVELDAHQDALQRALEVSGDGWLTTTRLRGSTWLRAGIVNYLSTEDDIDRLIETLRRLAAESGPPAEPRLAPRGRCRQGVQSVPSGQRAWVHSTTAGSIG